MRAAVSCADQSELAEGVVDTLADACGLNGCCWSVQRSGRDTFHDHCKLPTQLEQSPGAPGKLQPSVGADPVIGVHAEKGLLARLGELWTCPAHPVAVLHKADRL